MRKKRKNFFWIMVLIAVLIMSCNTKAPEKNDPVFSPPRNLMALPLVEENMLFWYEPIDFINTNLVGYKVYRNGVVLNEFISADITCFSDFNIEYSYIYRYWVTALYEDYDGESEPSNFIEIYPIPLLFLPPRDLLGEVDGSTIKLSWRQPPKHQTSDDLSGYTVYRDDKLLTPSYITDLNFTDFDMPEGVYTYWVCAVYSDEYSSPPSNVIIVEVEN